MYRHVYGDCYRYVGDVATTGLRRKRWLAFSQPTTKFINADYMQSASNMQHVCDIHVKCMQHTCDMHATCMEHICNMHIP